MTRRIVNNSFEDAPLTCSILSTKVSSVVVMISVGVGVVVVGFAIETVKSEA
jgi:hypothetical protein